MSKEKKIIPELRFPEFVNEGEWVKVELGTMTTKIGSGKTPKGGDKNYKKEGHPFVRSQNIGWGELLLDDIAYIEAVSYTHLTLPTIYSV